MRLVTVLIGLLSASVFAGEANYTAKDYPTRVLWGDTHLHTTNSLDARIFGVMVDAEGSYRFARGERVKTSSGHEAQLTRPLDFLVVSDHSDSMGIMDQLVQGNETLMKNAELRELREKFLAGGAGAGDDDQVGGLEQAA